MAKIVSICSSSKGNCTYVGDGENGILVDVGCSFKALRNGLCANGLSIDSVRGVFITHEHIDHIKGIYQLSKQTGLPIFASEGVLDYLICNNMVHENAELIIADENEVCGFEVKSFHTPHDSVESLGFAIKTGGKKFSVCTDLGEITAEVRLSIEGSDAVLLEANYDKDLLRKNPYYPAYLKKRIQSVNGHLSNVKSGGFLQSLVKSGTTRIILGHLSQENNTPLLAYESVNASLCEIGAENGVDYILKVAPVITAGDCSVCL